MHLQGGCRDGFHMLLLGFTPCSLALWWLVAHLGDDLNSCLCLLFVLCSHSTNIYLRDIISAINSAGGRERFQGE